MDQPLGLPSGAEALQSTSLGWRAAACWLRYVPVDQTDSAARLTIELRYARAGLHADRRGCGEHRRAAPLSLLRAQCKEYFTTTMKYAALVRRICTISGG